ncbi:MAG: C40 family peptidase [Lactobacillaceae bacterium]|nr:C40 family peptidase [Lactobacillaceae bacterium]
MEISKSLLTALTITTIPAATLATSVSADAKDASSSSSSNLKKIVKAAAATVEKRDTIYKNKLVIVKQTVTLTVDEKPVSRTEIQTSSNKTLWVNSSELKKLSKVDTKTAQNTQVRIVTKDGSNNGLYADPYMTTVDSSNQNNDAESRNGQTVTALQEAIVENADGSTTKMLQVKIGDQAYWIDEVDTTTNLFDWVSAAQAASGVPYVWGGSTMSGFDCSGFVNYVRANSGQSYLGRTTYQQAATLRAQGVQQVSLSEAQPGDLLFWGGTGSEYHVAIYAGNGMTYSATAPGQLSGLHPVFAGAQVYKMNLS